MVFAADLDMLAEELVAILFGGPPWEVDTPESRDEVLLSDSVIGIVGLFAVEDAGVPLGSGGCPGGPVATFWLFDLVPSDAGDLVGDV